MRKAQKKQAEDFLELLRQAHEEIKSAIEQRQKPTVLDLLADCQDGAAALGGLIEKTEGEGTEAVRLLEEYCELLFRIYMKISGTEVELPDGSRMDSSPGSADHVHQELKQILQKIDNSIRNGVKLGREVVFLPYKASMWDSLESVWRAADEDPDCDAYVIPIPYYDKKPDGSLGEMHYEADQYPADVPLTAYGAYDFETRRPDMIFIHNPYDECNYVTSVMPFFYSGNLKKYTERLIYIPYFVLGEPDIEDAKALEDMEKFCVVPGVMNADQVIVQSENMRQAYIKVLTKRAGANTRGYWEKKILGLGSPKTDKVLCTKKEDLEIPEEWMRCIRKPDGSWKKIILYNTGVTALLQYNEKMLEKMRDVFRIFRENREETALLWRPHPLIRATIEAMRPRLWEAYERLVREYRAEGFGIYDDSADMDRAVVLSDAYYGDWSSIVQLYRETGKPVMIQDVEAR